MEVGDAVLVTTFNMLGNIIDEDGEGHYLVKYPDGVFEWYDITELEAGGKQ